MKKITIIGAGIAGLTTAIALIQKGFEVELFEHSAEFKKAGSGINLAMNAMQVYKKLGVYNDIEKAASYTNTMNLRLRNMKVLSGMDSKSLEKQFGVKSFAIHRAVLHQILLDHVGDTKIHLDKKLTSLQQADNSVNLTFEDGTKHSAEMVIGADGIHSNVRKSIFENTELRDAEQVCWRGISNATLNKKYQEELNEIWAKGNRFGFVHTTKTETYWFALINKDELKSKEPDLLALFSDFPQVAKDIIKGTAKEDILYNEIWDLKPIKKWYKGNVCLVGDSAHATTPNMGQGACQAIESAYVFAACLAKENTTQAFETFEKIRKPKALQIVKTSWLLGKLAQTRNPILIAMRNTLMPLIPASINVKQLAETFKIPQI